MAIVRRWSDQEWQSLMPVIYYIMFPLQAGRPASSASWQLIQIRI